MLRPARRLAAMAATPLVLGLSSVTDHPIADLEAAQEVLEAGDVYDGADITPDFVEQLFRQTGATLTPDLVEQLHRDR